MKEEGAFLMTTTTRIIAWIARIAGVVALLLGLTFWATHIEIVSLHMTFGILLAFSFLILSIIMVATGGMRLWGAVGIVYSLILPVFGLTQSRLLTGNMHWLIQVAHLLVGLGALALIQVMYTRYLHLKQPVAEQTSSRSTITQTGR
jgi:thiol:disulfide interchange protein